MLINPFYSEMDLARVSGRVCSNFRCFVRPLIFGNVIAKSKGIAASIRYRVAGSGMLNSLQIMSLMFQKLLDCGATVNVRPHGCSLLQFAVCGDAPTKRHIDLLSRAGAV
jgi:hypothetical protein